MIVFILTRLCKTIELQLSFVYIGNPKRLQAELAVAGVNNSISRQTFKVTRKALIHTISLNSHKLTAKLILFLICNIQLVVIMSFCVHGGWVIAKLGHVTFHDSIKNHRAKLHESFEIIDVNLYANFAIPYLTWKEWFC